MSDEWLAPPRMTPADRWCYRLGALVYYRGSLGWVPHFRWWHPLTWAVCIYCTGLILWDGWHAAREELFAPRAVRQRGIVWREPRRNRR